MRLVWQTLQRPSGSMETPGKAVVKKQAEQRRGAAVSMARRL
jgi:hypothetical protein